MVLVGRSEGCGTSAIYSFNPVSGELADENEECISHDIIQTLFLPFMDRTHKRVLVYLDAAGSIGCYPSGCGGVSFSRISTFMYTVDKSNGILRGYKIVGESEPAMEVWQIAIPPTEKILVVANKMSHGKRIICPQIQLMIEKIVVMLRGLSGVFPHRPRPFNGQGESQ